MVKEKTVIAKLALLACFFALCVIGLGAFTRLIDAGLGCPDWPGCFGHFAVPGVSEKNQVLDHFPNSPFVSYKAWAEMTHRYFAGSLSILIMAIIANIIRKPYRNCSNIFFASCLILLLAYQIMLGQWTVTLKLLPIIVTQHLLGGFLILSTLWLLYLSNSPFSFTVGRASADKKIIGGGLIAFILIFIQIMLGAWTSTNYAALSCTDFPFCSNNMAVQFDFRQAFNLFSPVGINYEGGVLSEAARQTIHMVHRIGALVVTCYLLVYMLLMFRKIYKIPALLHQLYVIVGVLSIQLCIGISNIVFKLPLISAVSHNLVAALLLLSVLTFTFRTFQLNRVSAA